MEQERCQRLAQIPFDVIGEHAQEHMGAHAIGVPVKRIGRISRSTVFIERKAQFDSGEILVGLNRVRGAEVLSRHAGADDIDAVELGLGRDLIGLAGPAEVSVADVEGEVLGHLPGIHDFANRQADLCGSAQR